MKQSKVSGVLLSVLALGSASGVHAGDSHWTYGKHGGPTEWGKLDQAFSSCEVGKMQSPIDIRKAIAADLPAINFDYKPAPLKVTDNGHTIQVDYAPGSSIDVGGTRYELLQFHFHRPSEEKIDGKVHAMVAHLVHRGADGKLAVVSVLLDKGLDNATIHAILNNLPEQTVKELEAPVTVDATALLPNDKAYYTFEGSLTTPPCSEGVHWFVLKKPMTLAASQIMAFFKIYPMNARPTQALNGRLIEMTR